jgi:hypothetical protein
LSQNEKLSEIKPPLVKTMQFLSLIKSPGKCRFLVHIPTFTQCHQAQLCAQSLLSLNYWTSFNTNHTRHFVIGIADIHRDVEKSCWHWWGCWISIIFFGTCQNPEIIWNSLKEYLNPTSFPLFWIGNLDLILNSLQI